MSIDVPENRPIQILPIELEDLDQLKTFTDREIGTGYFSLKELEQIREQSLIQLPSGEILNCSFKLVQAKKILGVRLAFGPGRWTRGKGKGLRPDLWGVPQDRAGYFQSLFLSEDVRGQGFGPKLSKATEAVFLQAGAQAIVTHAWKESPDNSSIRYLTQAGFKPVAEHPEYWKDVDYECTHDGRPCRCTAVEMVKKIGSNSSLSGFQRG